VLPQFLVGAIENEITRVLAYLLRIVPFELIREYSLELAKYHKCVARRTRFALVNLLKSFRYAESTRRGTVSLPS
jgi:hypothetical protein